MTIKELKKGEWFTRKPIDEPTERQVYVRGEYVRDIKKYECWHWDDTNAVIYLKGETPAYVDFTF